MLTEDVARNYRHPDLPHNRPEVSETEFAWDFSISLYRLYLPRAIGGLELPPAAAFEVIEVLSRAHGSVGWCLMNANAISLGAGWLAPEVGRRMFGQPPNIRAAGSLRPQGRARPVEGNYQLSGKWNFASGALNVNWLFCPALIMDGDKPRVTSTGSPVALN